MRARRRKPMKIWHIIATYEEYSGPPENTKTHILRIEYDIASRTLPDAFMIFNRKYRIDGLVSIGITEGKQDEEETEG